jgi:DNA-binding YbaB/EbfC family protein
MKDLGQMMKQVQEMQARMGEAQSRLEEMTVTGRAGGDLVSVTLNGKGAMTGLTIDESLMKPEEREIVEDLIVAAHTDARAKVEQMVADQMKEVTGGLPLPPGMKLPF